MHTDQVPETEVPHRGILTGRVPAAVALHQVIPSQRLLIAGPVITAAAPVQALLTVVTDHRAQAGLLTPLQEAAHPEAATGLQEVLREAATDLLLPVAAADHLIAVEAAGHLQAAADHHQAEVADHLPAAAGPAAEEDKLTLHIYA